MIARDVEDDSAVTAVDSELVLVEVAVDSDAMPVDVEVDSAVTVLLVVLRPVDSEVTLLFVVLRPDESDVTLLFVVLKPPPVAAPVGSIDMSSMDLLKV